MLAATVVIVGFIEIFLLACLLALIFHILIFLVHYHNMYFPCVTSFHNGFTLLVSCASTICWLEGTQEASYLGWPIRTLQCPKYCISVCKSCNTMQIIHHCGTSGGPFSASRCLFRKGLYLQHQSKNRSSVSLLEVEEVSHLGGMGVSQR